MNTLNLDLVSKVDLKSTVSFHVANRYLYTADGVPIACVSSEFGEYFGSNIECHGAAGTVRLYEPIRSVRDEQLVGELGERATLFQFCELIRRDVIGGERILASSRVYRNVGYFRDLRKLLRPVVGQWNNGFGTGMWQMGLQPFNVYERSLCFAIGA